MLVDFRTFLDIFVDSEDFWAENLSEHFLNIFSEHFLNIAVITKKSLKSHVMNIL